MHLFSGVRARLWLAAALATGVSCTVGAGGAEGRIVPQQSIAGVELGMTPAQVRALKGAPRTTRRWTLKEPGPVRFTVYVYRRLEVSFADWSNGTSVQGVTTTSRRERTADGLGVGTTRARLLHTVPRLDCDAWTYRGRTTRICSAEPAGGIGIVTRYAMTAKWRVRSVSVAQIID